MPALPGLRQKAVEAIGAALTQKDIETLFMQATGKDIYNVVGTPNDPRALLISKALTKLEEWGAERWLLSLILIAIAQEKLRMLIVRTWPNDTLIKLPQVEGQVAKALTVLGAVLNTPLSPGLRSALKPKHDAFDEILRRIAELYAYESLHEHLHVLHLKLVVVGSAPGGPVDFNGILARCDEIAAQAPQAVALLRSSEVELAWISQAATMAASLKAAVAASDTASCLRIRDAIQALTRIHLSRLNTRVFKAANELSFEALVMDLPLDIEAMDTFAEFDQAFRGLKPTVISRALKQSMWQQLEKQISLIADLISVPGQEFSEFSEHWFELKSRVLWLANLDPDDPWAKQAQQSSDEVDDALIKEKLDDDIRHRFESYRNLLGFRFLAIDNTLKQDCSSLQKITVPLSEILRELKL